MARPRVGVAMLDTRFPRIPGDIGCAETFDPPALIERVGGSRVRDAVTDAAHDDGLVEGFIAAAQRLRRRGADIIATSCGFLSPLQSALEDAVPATIVSSVLIDLPDIRRSIDPGSAIGILTFDSRKLGFGHLPESSPPYQIAGLENGDELFPVISNDQPHLNEDAARNDALTSAKHLLGQDSEISVLVLECTNLPPYQPQIEELTGRPVYSIRNAIEERMRMLVDPSFGDRLTLQTNLKGDQQ